MRFLQLSLGLATILSLTVQAQNYYGSGYSILSPEKGGDDLSAVVYRTLPAGSVKNALDVLLSGTGWQLADDYAADPMIYRLYNQYLPTQKQQIGPMSLSDALDWIGGSAWRLVVDPVNKLISFEVRKPYRQSRSVVSDPTIPDGDVPASDILIAAPAPNTPSVQGEKK